MTATEESLIQPGIEILNLSYPAVSLNMNRSEDHSYSIVGLRITYNFNFHYGLKTQI